MRWQQGRRSGNVVDRRGSRRAVVGGGLGGLGLLLAVGFVILSGGDLGQVLNLVVQNVEVASSSGRPQPPTAEENELADFVSVVLADTEDTWARLFQEQGLVYREPKLVLFSGRVQSACGFGQAAMGPFYCPGDEHVYIDLSFYDELKRNLNAPGDFAQAYVIAHEIGHHVQNLMGLSDEVHEKQRRLGKEEANRLSVRLELQADFFAGVWAFYADRHRRLLEPGDLDEALRAATAIGDDRLQKQAQGYIVPDSFTHGTSAQRVRWFRRGFESGDLSQGDTFGIPYDSL